MSRICTRQIGDGRTPNKYWVIISEDYYYNSPSTSQLDDVFDEIASKLLKLRLSK